MPYLDAARELPFQSGSDTSREAALAAKQFVGQQGVAVLKAIADCGPAGATQKEISAALGIGRPSICARFNALEQSWRIVKTAHRRNGCAVYRIAAV